MRVPMRSLIVGACVVALLAGGLALAVPEGGGVAGGAGQDARRARLRRFATGLEYPRWIRRIVEGQVREKYKGDPKAAEGILARVKWEVLEDWVVEEFDTRVDDATLDEVLPILDTPEGKRTVALLRATRCTGAIDLFLQVFGDREGERGMQRLQAGYEKAREEAVPTELDSPMKGARTASNETAAMATLKSLTSAQATVQNQGRIDADRDGQGEYGTFLEITSQSGVRDTFVPGTIPGARFGGRGSKINPPIISTSVWAVDADGIVTKGGYCFRIYLPDTANPAGFVHETGPAEKVGLAGGTGMVGVDLSEVIWCAYAWPVEYGKSGTKAFFVNQANDVMQSSNEAAKWSGTQKAPPGNSAFCKGAGITGMIAQGTRGNDGDFWKTN